MNKIKIFEPAMCCSSGVCGVGVDAELLRIQTIINNLKNIGVVVERYNLTNAPQEFVDNKVINEFINKKGVEKLPVILVDDKIVMYGRYPSNDEIGKLLKIFVNTNKTIPKKTNDGGCGCNCDGGCS